MCVLCVCGGGGGRVYMGKGDGVYAGLYVGGMGGRQGRGKGEGGGREGAEGRGGRGRGETLKANRIEAWMLCLQSYSCFQESPYSTGIPHLCS